MSASAVQRKHYILGIESSCDETAAAVVDAGMVVRSSVVASQYDLHAEYGGVVPEIASRAHLERILPVVRKALDEAGVSAGELAAVAAGVRPGLIGSLLVGASAAKGLAFAAMPALGHRLFSGQGFRVWLIECGGDVVGLAAMGLVIGPWH